MGKWMVVYIITLFLIPYGGLLVLFPSTINNWAEKEKEMNTPNPFPRFIVDDSSGETVKNQRWEDWQQGNNAHLLDSDIPRLQCIVADLEDYWKHLGTN